MGNQNIIKTYLTIEGVFVSFPQNLLMSIGPLIRNDHPVQPTGQVAQTGLDVLVVAVSAGADGLRHLLILVIVIPTRFILTFNSVNILLPCAFSGKTGYV